MKRVFAGFLIVLMLCTGAFAGGDFWCKGSDEQTASAVITASGGLFHGIILATDGSNAVTLSIYDHATAASGEELIPTTTITSSATDRVQSISISPAIRVYKGIYVSISVAGQGTVAYTVYYKNEND